MQTTCGKRNETVKDDYYLKQILTTCLSQYSYYIESNKEAIIIDPLREADIYDEILKTRGAKLKYVLETHFHADFVSGHYELAHKYGAQIVFGPTAKTEFKIKLAEDGEMLPLGSINIKVLHTPGHTLESSSFLLIDSNGKEQCLFSGDTLFLGDIGRPDLAVKEGVTEFDLAGMLYESVQKIVKLSDDVTVYPGHGAGSACGKNISSGDYDSLGNQKKTNYALNPNLSKEEFVEILTSNLPTPPQYFFYDVMLNKKGYEYIENIMEKGFKPVDLESFKKLVQEPSVVVIDSRDIDVAGKGFIPGSIVLSLKMTFAIWAATLFKPETKFILVTEPGKERESIIRITRVGLDNILGYLEGGFDTWKQGGDETLTYEFYDVSDKDPLSLTVVDVREKKEWDKTGVIPNSHLISLSQLHDRLDEVPKDNDVVVICNSAQRASTAISILRKNGFKTNLLNAVGGVQYLISHNYDKFVKPTY